LHRARLQLRAKGESAPLRLTVTERATRSTESLKKLKRVTKGKKIDHFLLFLTL